MLLLSFSSFPFSVLLFVLQGNLRVFFLASLLLCTPRSVQKKCLLEFVKCRVCTSSDRKKIYIVRVSLKCIICFSFSSFFLCINLFVHHHLFICSLCVYINMVFLSSLYLFFVFLLVVVFLILNFYVSRAA